ncbi:MAG: hypothetical protein KDD61_08010 [Bdellovibrionales bacterium]|nr:hypothetical protein [Bdellovibrionales bacterium]
MKRFDRLVLVISAVTLVISALGLFYFDRFIHVSTSDNYDIIAMTTHVTGIVRRRPAKGFTFYTLEKGDELPNGEYVFTSESSSTMLDFVTGTRIKVHENSLIRVKKIDGGVEVQIESEDGVVSGTIGEKDKLKVKSKKDLIELSGEDEPQFEVTAKNGHMEVEAFKKNLKIKNLGKERVLQNQKISLKEEAEKEEKKEANAPNSGTKKESIDRKGSANALDTGKSVRVGIVDEYEFSEVSQVQISKIRLKTPYPEESMIFLHTKGGEIIVLPKAICKSNCELQVFEGDRQIFQKLYITNQVPATILRIKQRMFGNYFWTYKDEEGSLKGNFGVRQRTKEAFNEAVLEKRAIEVLN